MAHNCMMLRDATVPITLIVGGLLLLAWNLGWIPERDSLIALAFIAAGVAVLVLDGLTRKSLVTAPLLMAFGVAWYGYFELGWRSRLIIPLLMIFAGLLMLAARFAPLPETREQPKGLPPPSEQSEPERQ
jgi:hypothetical protein